jgi:ferrous iron transport protein A
MSTVASALECPPDAPRQSLADLGVGETARIAAVSSHRVAGMSVDATRRLYDLGFLPGEHVRVVARGPFGREPIAVRIGTATFALRRFEAECIRIVPTWE